MRHSKIVGHQMAMMLSLLEHVGPLTPPDLAAEWQMKTGEKLPRGSLHMQLNRLVALKMVVARRAKGGRSYPSPQRIFRIVKKGRIALYHYKMWTNAV